MAGAITTYEETGIWTRRAHPHNGYSSGFSPSRSEWGEWGEWDRPSSATRPGTDRSLESRR
jgi:hypothetical protein